MLLLGFSAFTIISSLCFLLAGNCVLLPCHESYSTHLNLLQALRPRWLKASLEACVMALATLIVTLVMEVAATIVASINVIFEHAIQLPI
jgi:hypothetical protein